ncbi:hypothetical protein AB0L41_43225 [Amycolatopsis mediterranei]|uniref:hypothetical protein n=1 Tax=Amycolatopsis mediterranei TaxID=33910 RepID=UPI003415C013
MPRYERFVEELLGFLLARLDEPGFARLVAHEPKRMMAAYFEGAGGRAETRTASFTGCIKCSQIPPTTLFRSHGHIDAPAWPCMPVRELTLSFAEDPDYRDEWRPKFTLVASGQLLHQPDQDQLS